MGARRIAAAVALMLVAVVGGLAVSTMPASASASGGYIHGTSYWGDDWWDEGVVSASSYAHSNVAAMWQAILWADGNLNYSDIDCWFGSKTTTATKAWQSKRGLYPDGLVGNNTFQEASYELYEYGSNLVYEGSYGGRYVTFNRDSSGYWRMYIGSDLRLLGYNFATFNVCL